MVGQLARALFAVAVDDDWDSNDVEAEKQSYAGHFLVSNCHRQAWHHHQVNLSQRMWSNVAS